MAVVLYAVFAVIGLAYFWIINHFNYWKKRGFPSPPTTFPFGSFKGVGSTITSTEKVDIFYRQYKGKAPAVGLFYFFKPTILPIDPELHKNIFMTEFSAFPDRGSYYNKEDDPLFANISTLEGIEWSERRKKLSPIFTSGKVKMMFEVVNALGDKLVDALSKQIAFKNEIDIQVWSQRFTTDVIGNIAFGFDCNCLNDPDSLFMKYGRQIFKRVSGIQLLRYFLWTSFPNLSRKLHIRVSDKEASDFFYQIFCNTLVERKMNVIKRNDFVSLLLNLKEKLTPSEMAAESFLFYLAGFETSSGLVNFTLYELALNPIIQEKLRDEIITALMESDGNLTYEMVLSLKYLDMVVNESLRKYPPIPNASRVCTKDYPIPGTNLTIPAGTFIEMNLFSLQRDPEYYPDPMRFDPERFSPNNVNPPYTFLPFGAGRRNCLGLRFGLMQSKIAIIKIIRSFIVTINSKSPIPMKFVPSAPILISARGMCLTLQEINEQANGKK